MDAARAAWETFQHGDEPPVVAVPPAILESWRRSRALAVPPDLRVGRWAGQAPGAGPHGEAFVAAGTAVVRGLAGDLRGSRCVVALADAGGTVVARAGDPDMTRRTDAAQMVPGAAWTEGAAGTNGLGLALTLGRPVQVVAAEHFCVGWHAYGCTSVPVHHPLSGELLGALDLTTRAGVHDRPVIAALVRRAAAEVELRLAERLRGGGATPLRDVERDAILRALDDADGNVTAAAEALGVSRATVYRRLRTYRALGRPARRT